MPTLKRSKVLSDMGESDLSAGSASVTLKKSPRHANLAGFTSAHIDALAPESGGRPHYRGTWHYLTAFN